MNTLLIDTHADFIFLAIYQNDKLIIEKEITEKKDHSTLCFQALIKLLSDAHAEIQDINDLIVVIGPGSFTGVRIGVTIAKTLAYTLKIPIRTMTSLELYLDTKIDKDTYLALEEKNGYYIGKIEKNNIIEYTYLKKDEFSIFYKENKIYICSKINKTMLAKYAHQKQPVNPHLVNPFYVKKIEVEKKWLEKQK